MEMAAPQWEPPSYLKGCPKDRALVASDGKSGVVLHHIGPALDYWLDHHGEVEGDWEDIPAGLWIVEARIDTSGVGMFEDYDEELVLGEPRVMTVDEWADYREEGVPWDSTLWYEPCEPEAPRPSPVKEIMRELGELSGTCGGNHLNRGKVFKIVKARLPKSEPETECEHVWTCVKCDEKKMFCDHQIGCRLCGDPGPF